ncbi:hypothetical protein L7D48_02535 [Streptomyces sp. S1A]|uniref:hypothetical protein n=1 Tax=Streptomyces sp. ICN903 TaxID=2964654 RepID=UPI001EDC1790|nr:hypothetical protein [Streptomyces sp. ICN903]MCG3039459.1 hypothetical protein [Streptomyces sp. ICN903]
MKPLTLVRSSSALRVAPVVLLLVFAYYATDLGDDLRIDPLGYSATVVDAVLRNLLPVAFAVASGLAAWEARKLGASEIWRLGAVRSRYTVAAQQLAPVVVLAWLILTLPALCALVQEQVVPDPPGLVLLAFALVLCVAHAVVGFAAGTAIRHIAVVPVVAVTDFLAVGWSTGLSIPWPRHLTGLFAGKMMFGELPTPAALAAPLLLAVGTAGAMALLWAPVSRLLRGAVAGVLALACAFGSFSLVGDWSYIGPRSTGHGALACAGQAPRICLPEARAEHIQVLTEEAGTTLETLRRAGLTAEPASITDTSLNLRYPEPSTEEDWNVPLAVGAATGTVRYQIAREAVRFECAPPATGPARQVYYWVSSKVGQAETYLKRLSTEPDFTARERSRLQNRVGEVLRLSRAQQLDWYEATVAEACEEDRDAA